MDEVTLLSREQIFGENKLNIFKKINNSAKITDFSILLGGYYSAYNGRTGYYWTKYNIIDILGCKYYEHTNHRNIGIRPVISYSKIKNDISNEIISEDGITEIEYGEYPQKAVNIELQDELEELYKIMN